MRVSKSRDGGGGDREGQQHSDVLKTTLEESSTDQCFKSK